MNVNQDHIDYLVVCVNDFADMYGMNYIQGYDYLKNHAGLDYILKNYDIEHSYPIERTEPSGCSESVRDSSRRSP